MNFSPGWVDYVLLALFALLFGLSGWLTWSLAWGRAEAREDYGRSGTNGQTLSCLDALLGCLLCSLAVTSGILLLTAEIGIFRIRFWLLLLAAYDVSVFLLSRLPSVSWRKKIADTLEGKNPRHSPFGLFPFSFNKSDLWSLLLAPFAFLALNRPAEFVATHRDPGKYVNIGIKLSQTGSLRFKDPDFTRFDQPEKQSLFLQDPLRQAPFPEVLPGFYLTDASKGELLPQFFHLYPLWLSVCFKLWRFEGVFLLNVCLGTLSILLLLPLAQRVFNSKFVGLGAALLLASNPGQIWLSRSPFSEVLAQVFLLGGLWLLAVGMTSERRGCTVLAGVLFGLCFFVRIDSFLILLALAPLLFYRLIDRKALFWPLTILAAYSLVHAFLFSFPYFGNVLETVRRSPLPWQAWFLLGGMVALGLIWLARRRAHLRSGALDTDGLRSKPVLPTADPRSDTLQKPNAGRFQHWVRTALLALLSLTFVYGLFLRPYLESSREVIPLPPPHVGTVPLYNEMNWVRLSWYLTPLGLGLALFGALQGIRRLTTGKSTALIPFAMILAVFAGFYLYKSRAFPDNYWVVRRYIEIAVPGLLLLACFALRWIYLGLSRFVAKNLSLLFSSLLFLAIWAGEIRAIAPLWKERELVGSLQQMELLASLSAKGDILLLERGTFQEFFSTPLKVIFQKTVYPLASVRPDVPSFERLVQQWLDQGKRIYLLASQEQTDLQSRRLHFVPQHRFEFKSEVVEATYERLPKAKLPLNYTVQIYEVRPSPQTAPPKAVTLNMDFNLGYATNGFHPAEISAERETFRWTSGAASLDLPDIAAEDNATLSLSLAQDLPERLSPSPVKILFNDHLIAERRFTRKFEVLRWTIPQTWLNANQRNRLAFESTTYSPAQTGNSEDQRQLGIMLEGVKLQSSQPISEDNPLYLDLGNEADVLDADLTAFFGREPDSYRWTGSEAEVRLLVSVDTSKPLRLSLRAVKSCPDHAFRQWLSASLDGVVLGKTELVGVGTQFQVYEFKLPHRPASAARSVIRLNVSPAWNPSQGGRSADSRTLGCAIDWIRIKKAR